MFNTPKKKKVVKLKEKLDDSFLRRSKRIFVKLQGYKDVESASKAKNTMPVHTGEEPMPLAVVPSPGTKIAPHLPREILMGIGEGFL